MLVDLAYFIQPVSELQTWRSDTSRLSSLNQMTTENLSGMYVRIIYLQFASGHGFVSDEDVDKRGMLHELSLDLLCLSLHHPNLTYLKQ